MIDDHSALVVATANTEAATTSAPRAAQHHQPMETAVRLYLREIGAVPLLTAAQEVSIASRVAAGARATSALEMAWLPPEARRGHAALIAHEAVAQHQLIEANLRLVVSVAKRYANRGVTLLDLIQEGNVGLMRAVGRFDHTRGLRFSTYATWWIRQGILSGLADQGRTIRLPVHVLETVQRITRTLGRLQQEHGRDATAAEVGRELDIPATQVRALLAAAQGTISLDAPVGPAGDEGQRALTDLLPDAAAPSPDDVASQTQLQAQITRALEYLPEREQHVLQLRFGLVDGHPWTLDEAGAALCVSRERIRQIEFRALRRLRSSPHRHHLLAYLN